ncbi:conserved hypothetical protein [Allomeiothermus silvanus DSM 9946]|uniref:Uncharacterized protein n=1 Tax=Allomeiothermus silvanus (strain ATCC 700542 / DSM 9946 / NBRC 106475 / NCIMB 13440 / VI-R2) TaxID=526227 RepID=D7BEK5_ALLS1|nr:hypothetical protein [Allomeiothermus silvanus]ADH63248.1 conserved hypothetical protein [Allomeiothermus silvanus DSM 9946]
MLDPLVGLVLVGIGVWFVRRTRLPWEAAGVWLNLLWFLYQHELGSGWVNYLRGLGLAFMLAATGREYALAWVLTPWPLLLLLGFNLSAWVLYLPPLGEGLMAGALVYLLVGWMRR